MLQLTLHAPDSHATAVAAVLDANDYTLNVVRLAGACLRPAGDVVSCMVPREAVAELLHQLHDVGFDESIGSITFDEHLTVLSTAAADAERRAAGAPGDALLWPVVRASTGQAAELSFTYLAFMVLATFLAAIGLLTSSSVLIVGAMILGPEFGALAHICVASLSRDLRGVGSAVVQLVLGFLVAIVATALFTGLLDLGGFVASSELTREFERTMVSPTWLGLFVACIAGVAGVLTLTSAKGDALIGVLVSVTTIPAAADMSIGIAFTDGSRIADGAATLLINLGGMVVAGAATLFVRRGMSRS